MFKKEKPEELAREILMLCNVYKKSPKESGNGKTMLVKGSGHLAFDKQ